MRNNQEGSRPSNACATNAGIYWQAAGSCPRGFEPTKFHGNQQVPVASGPSPVVQAMTACSNAVNLGRRLDVRILRGRGSGSLDSITLNVEQKHYRNTSVHSPGRRRIEPALAKAGDEGNQIDPLTLTVIPIGRARPPSYPSPFPGGRDNELQISLARSRPKVSESSLAAVSARPLRARPPGQWRLMRGPAACTTRASPWTGPGPNFGLGTDVR